MTERDAVEKLRAYHKCQRLQVKGIYEDCNNKRCDDCDLCYMQGTTGEHMTAIGIAIQALEKQIPKKPIFDYNLSDTLSKFHCECGNIIKVSHDAGIMSNNNAPNYCSKCGCSLDWSDAD